MSGYTLSQAERRRPGVSPGGTRPSSAAGILLLEVLAALALTGVLLAVMAAVVVSYDRAADHFTAHHQAQLAAESCVERLRAGLPPSPDTSRVRYLVDRRPGCDAWVGLTRLTVTAEVQSRHGRTARHTVNTYLREDHR